MWTVVDRTEDVKILTVPFSANATLGTMERLTVMTSMSARRKISVPLIRRVPTQWAAITVVVQLDTSSDLYIT